MHKRPIHGGTSWEIVDGRVEELRRIIPADVCDAWYPPASEVIEGLRAALSYVQYAPETWGDSLREFVAEHYGLEEGSVFVDAGSSPLIHRILERVGARKGNVVLVSPTYSEYRAILEQCEVEIRTDYLRLDERLRIDVDRLLTLVDNHTSAIVICNPNNPTGSAISQEEILRLIHSVPESVSIIVDEVYTEYTPECSVLRDTGTCPSLCVIRSFSKTHALAGLRAGFAAIGLNNRSVFTEVEELPWRISLLSDIGVRLALHHEQYMRHRIDETKKLREAFRKNVAMIGSFEPFSSETNFFLIRIVDSSLTAAQTVRALKESGILIKEVERLADSPESEFIRITTRSQNENDRVVLALRSVAMRS